MTCGESRFVVTVINALCHSFKIKKEAEVFFPFFYFFHVCTVHTQLSFTIL